MLKHYTSADDEPSYLSKDKLTLYMFQFCPFSRRVALTLSHHNVEHERVYIDVNDKPVWFLRDSPSGKVPMLAYKGQRLVESEMICRFIDQRESSMHLFREETADGDDAVMRWFNQVFKSFHAIAWEKTFSEEDKKKLLSSLETFGLMFNNYGFACGRTTVSYGDFVLYPIMEIMDICLDRINDSDTPHYLKLCNRKYSTQISKYERIYNWFKAMDGTLAVEKERISDDTHREFIKTKLSA